ncbi:chemotaxis-specific protein-glutamate methyltransferase CheB [Geopsychrobacter electrodiphilus]|uniref:chemotaxis-specific protein-glutamate methyltransferase CheB n=1 Tax=Geopsychrobacter electrodiphilus TaxID=225196 RepID=UPI0004783C19
MKKIRVLVVDDSAFNRVSIGKMLEQISEVEIVGYAADGEAGLRKVFDLKPDLVTLDLEMPKMGGFSMLRLIMKSCPTPVLVISSRSGDADVFKALELGAIDFVAKPSRPISSEFYSIQTDLERKIRDFSSFEPDQFRLQNSLRGEGKICSDVRVFAGSPVLHPPKAVVIGSSTGGPPALHHFLSEFKTSPGVSFAVAQHMPPGFTRSFADRLNDHSVFTVTEAATGDCMRPGHVYICPGGCNMLLRRFADEVKIQIVTPDESQIYTPSVDALFKSAASVYGAELLGIVLTGMGNDGAAGVRDIKEAGGRVIAEAEDSCVVYGMPKEAIATGCVSLVVPLSGLCEEIKRCCVG